MRLSFYSCAQSNRSIISGRMAALSMVFAALTLAGCASRMDRAPVVDLTTETGPIATSVTTGSTYIVKPGDTLYSIARSQNLNVNKLAEINNISDPSQLKQGQVLRIDEAIRSDGSEVATTVPVKTEPEESKPSDNSEKVEETSKSEPATDTARASDAGKIDWGWPVKGKIIQQFNASTKGIDIEGNLGDPVIAAASGQVVYAGNGVRGMGNLLLIGHSDGFITAYAHNEKLLAKAGQEIKKGEKIATLGQSDTTSPRLHFEIRRRGTPVNPLSYLPSQ